MVNCEKCKSRIGFFGKSKGHCEENCSRTLCADCVQICGDCGKEYCDIHIDSHECKVEDDSDSDEQENQETNDKTEEAGKETTEEIDLESAEGDEILIYSDDRQLVALDNGALDDLTETFEYVKRLGLEGYNLVCIDPNHNWIFKKVGQ